jgi:basic membrane protein A
MRGWRRREWTAGAVALALALAAPACGGGGEAAQPQEEKKAAGVSVGLVTDIGGLNDRGFNSLAADGIKRAERELGIEARILESKSDSDYIPNLSTLAEEGVDLSISVGFLMGDATRQAAEEFPETRYAIIDYAYEEADALANLQGYLFKEQESGYLAGYMAGLVTEEEGERTNPESVVSTVGGQAIPPVDRFIAGFQKGARDANPDVETLNAYSQDFVDQARCKEIALDQIAKDSDVVFQVAGGCGLGALDAAGERNVWAIGVDKDQASTGPQVLTSALKRVDVAVFEAIKAVVDDSFKGGGATTLGLADDGVGLGKISAHAPGDVVARVEARAKEVEADSVEIPEQVEK